MRRVLAIAAALLCQLSAAAPAMTLQQGAPAGGHRSAAVDPDAHLEALAAASTRENGNVHGRPNRTNRSILKDDPQLRAAFAWLSNK